MIPRMLFASLSALAIFLPIRDAAAVEPLSTTELAEHCAHYAEDTAGKDAIFCVRYVQGFIDGAVATDERVTWNVAAEYERKETYAERVIRTRSARRVPARLSRYGATVYADFCARSSKNNFARATPCTRCYAEIIPARRMMTIEPAQ